MESLPGWVISSMPGPPPRQHKHERQYTPSTHSVKPTRRIWNDDYDGQMIFGDPGGLKFPDICLTGEEKPRKKHHPGNLSRPGIEPRPVAWQARMLPLAPQRWTRRNIIFKNILRDRCSLRKIKQYFMIIFRSKSCANTAQKAKGSVLWMRKQKVDVQLAKLIVEKRKQQRSGHLLLLSLFGQVIEGMREVTNRWATEWLQLFRK